MRRQRRQIGCVRDEYADRDFDRPIINMPLESVHQLANRQPDHDSATVRWRDALRLTPVGSASAE